MSFKELPLMEPKDGTVLFYPYISKSSFSEVKKVLSGRWIGQGPLVDKFERKFKSMFEKLQGFAAEWKLDDADIKDVVSPSSRTVSIASETTDEIKRKEGGNGQIVVVIAHFTAEGYDARRKMIYTVCDGKICRIEHMDINNHKYI